MTSLLGKRTRAQAPSPGSVKKLLDATNEGPHVVKATPAETGFTTSGTHHKQDATSMRTPPMTQPVPIRVPSKKTCSPKALHTPRTVTERALSQLKGLVVEVEGNIGSGKSTLTRNLREESSKTYGELTSVFGEQVNNTFLEAFYKNSKRYSFAFQMYMLSSRIFQLDESARQARDEGKLVFLDRGAVGDTLFALLNFKMGNMDSQEMRVYRSVCKDRLPSSLSDSVNVLLYLDVEASECHDRVLNQRKNKAEEGIPLSYLDGVDHCYFHLLMDWMGVRKGGFHEMNIGEIPNTLVLQWDSFGDTERVIQALADLRDGKRASPTVNFQRYAPQDDAKQRDAVDLKKYPFLKPAAKLQVTETWHTAEDIKKAFASWKQRKVASTELAEESGECKHGTDPTDGSLCVSGVDCHTDASFERPVVAINWDLEHDNAFRRCVMWIMSRCGHVCFYGRSVAPTRDDDEKTEGA